MKLRHVISAPLAGAVLCAGVFALAAETPSSRVETFEKLELFADVLGQVESDYVSDVEASELIDDAIQGMLRSLDPHSSYLTADSFKDMQVSTRGEYGGLGIEVIMEEGVIKVVSPMDGTPADRAGVEAGDYITHIDGDPILGKSQDEAIDIMRGAPGEPITVTIVREAVDPFDVTIVREVITLKPVSWRVEGDDIGVIRVATFNDQASDAVEDAVRDLKKELGANLAGVVFDLRDNPGGLLDQAVSISDIVLDGGEVVSTRGREARDIDRYNARPGDLLEGVDVAVLINQGSASASEIVAGAIQDRRRGVVVGRTSFGKGSVQTVIPLRGGRAGAIRLTTALYYTPSGRSIQTTGIEPDLHVAARRPTESATQARRTISESDLPNAIANETGDEREEELTLEYPPEDFPEDQDYQLTRALDLLRGITVTDATAVVPG